MGNALCKLDEHPLPRVMGSYCLSESLLKCMSQRTEPIWTNDSFNSAICLSFLFSRFQEKIKFQIFHSSLIPQD